MAGTNGATLVSLQRLQLFKALQDTYNAATFLGIHATADAATVLATARTIDGVSFDGSSDITLPTKIVQLWYTDAGDPAVRTWYSDSAKTQAVTEFDTAKFYINMEENIGMFYNGSTLVNIAAVDNTERIPMSMKGAANGVAELDSTGLVPASQLPSYVDDVIEVIVEESGEPATKHFYNVTDAGTKGTEIVTGEKGKIYVDINATIDGSYRWSGSQFVAIGSSVSTADRAINDGNGDQIDTTYVKVRTGYDLMSDEQATQLQTLVDHDYDEATVAQIEALFDSATVTAYNSSQSQGGGE